MRNLDKEERWIENIYDVDISGDLGELRDCCIFNSNQNIEEQIDRQVKNVAFAFWQDKDGNYNSLLAVNIWEDKK